VRRRAAGFTLIEVLVALAIAALGLGALMATVGTGLANTAVADRYLEATRRAQSLLAAATIPPLLAGERSGTDASGLVWRVRVSAPLQHAAPSGAQSGSLPGLYAVAVTITWSATGGGRGITLQTQRMAPVGPDGG
jgi:general secretion pathway protein I